MGAKAPTFPTLAEQLAAEAPRADDVATKPLVAIFANEGHIPDALAALPPESIVVTLRGDAGRPVATDTHGEDRVATPTTFDELVEIVRANDGDVLLVSHAERLTGPVLAGLRAALDRDSACSTASVDDDSRPAAPGLPPPAIDAPRTGVVLVRRSDFLLAVDEADLGEPFVAGPAEACEDGPIVAKVLASLDRPGFVHRAFGVEGETLPLPRSAGRSRLRIERATVVIDGTCLANPRSGTQVHTLGLVGGLARAGADVAVMRPGELHPTVLAHVRQLEHDVPFLERRRLGRPDVFHRPFQIVSLHDLADRLTIAERLVLTHQDMIWDRTRAYHASDARRDYRRGTTAALASADQVGFFSLHAAKDAASDGALELDRVTVVPPGVDHLACRDAPDAVARPLEGRPYLLMVGSSFWHKNRIFSLRLLRRLVEECAWDGGLVLAGGNPGRSSSAAAEDAYVQQHSSLSGRVLDLGHVPDDQQLALYRSADLVLFPSLYEGFGFIPFEAAALGTAAVYTRRSAMGDFLPAVGALPSFEVEQAGDFVLGLLDNREARERIVEAISAVAAGLTWDRTAAGYLEVYERALSSPKRSLSSLLLEEFQRRSTIAPREAALLDVYRRRRGFRIFVDATIRVGMTVRDGLRRTRHKAAPRR